MATETKFKKGDKVHYIGAYNNKGKFGIHALTVYSCGKKQMVLVNAAGEKFMGCHFMPTEIQRMFNVAETEVVMDIVLGGLTDEQAEAKALELAAAYKPRQIRDYNEKIERWGHNPHYAASMRAEIAAVEADEVGFIWRTR